MSIRSDQHTDEQHTMTSRSKHGKTDKSKDMDTREPRPRWVEELLDWTKTLGIAVVIVLLANTFLFNLSKVEGSSMEPTLEEGEWLFINKIGYRFGSPERGDVVILKDPSQGVDKKEFLVKRVIGIPGDRIEVREGLLYLNGELFVEKYTDVDMSDSFGPYVVPEEHFFVLGDNRRPNASKDSRAFQAVPKALIKGEAELVLWPVTRWTSL